MKESQTFRRYPACRCWIKHILEGNYIEEDRSIGSIFGKIKRVRIVGTILNKKMISVSPENSLNDIEEMTIKYEIDLGDSTGLIKIIQWNAEKGKYKDLKIGDMVSIVGLIRKWKDYISISPEIIRKVENPNFILLQDAEIIKKIKLGKTYPIPIFNEEVDYGGYMKDFDVKSFFEDNNNEENSDLQNIIFEMIKKVTYNDQGISLDKLSKRLNKNYDISNSELKNILYRLERESKIYQSEEEVYQSY